MKSAGDLDDLWVTYDADAHKTDHIDLLFWWQQYVAPLSTARAWYKYIHSRKLVIWVLSA